ncbi:2-hydroxyacid dehydrogenase [Thalassobacillus devorans]|uniref:2-hydroxyacid dehydrogenase n=1 Tax=Thalassobacillus devorans TaxID=279813 RepID=UPI000A1C7A9D|nr:D-glycerate dehydrogenase [Thalassobacillus devorans]
MKPKIYITRKLPEEIVNYLQEHCDVKMWEKEDVPVPRNILEREIKDVDGLYCLLTENIDKSLLDQAKHLKIVSNMAVGYNNIDIKYASERGIKVTNTPEVLTETTADLTFALLMTTARRLVEVSEVVRNGEWKTWSPMAYTGQDIYGATLGIVGMGRIGEALAKRAKGFDMNILYYNRSRKIETENKLGVKYVDFESLLSESDFICIMTPYTHETRNLFGSREFSLMKPTAILINTARGGIVNEEALYQALIAKEIWAAGLDVFENEPVDTNHPLLKLSNVVSLPHVGSASIKTRIEMGILAATNLVEGVSGRVPPNQVN